jgi:hypothetical protein
MSQFISLQQAIEMTTLYRLEKENILAVPFKNQNILCKSETFARDVFDSVLAQPGCTGLRVYYGMDPTFKVHAIVVGVNNNNEDILPSALSSKSRTLSLTGGDEGIIETGNRCPDDCPPESDLNG